MTADRSREERVEEQDSVKVCVRIRPLSSKEKQEQTKSCIRIAASFDGLSSSNSVSSRDGSAGQNKGPQQLIVGRDRAFTFDNVLGVTSSQTDTYQVCVAPLVKGFLEGYNATVLAYGQTGTGKTHTMAGSGFDARGREKNGDLQGTIPRVIKAVFKRLQQDESGDNQRRCEHILRVEYVEIYNEELRDLLHPETTSKQLAIREDGEGNIVIAGAKSELADTKEAVFRHLVVGGASRVTGSTLMNENSSRSHAIFSLLLEQRDLTSGARRLSKFHLVDLAGSERAKRTGAVAGRFKESVSINQGLLALGNVISALGDDKRRIGSAGNGSGIVHVPYRDSKLTRLLQDSLGGNARTLMIACVSPASVNFEETLNTLKYANRAKNIKNKPIVNDRVASAEERVRNDEVMSRMREEIANLQTQLQQQKTETPPSRPPSRPYLSMGKKEKQADQDQELAIVGRELSQATKCVRLYGDAVESIRTYSMEAATLLVAMEREIKSLGRPVQQRLNEIVKLLNTSIQTANGSELSAKKLLPSQSRRCVDKDIDPACQDEEKPEHEEETVVVQKLRHELKEAKANLTRDEQIFEMKNTDIQRLQALLVEAKGKNEKLIQRVQELERGGQLWSNSKAPSSSSDVHAKQSPRESDQVESKSSSLTTTASPSGRSSRSASTSGSKTLSSSRGLFTRRGGTAAYDGDDDKVVMDTPDEEGHVEESKMPTAPRKFRAGSPAGFARPSASSRGDSSRGSLTSGSRLKTSEAIGKLESTITALQAKLEELQKKNEELLDAREESTRRWALERQNYERQLNEAEHSIEALKRDNQVLEESVLEDKRSEAKASTSSSRLSLSAKETVTSFNQERPRSSASSKSSRPPTARKSHATSPIDKEAVVSAFESSVKQLIEYHATRRELVYLLKGKKEAEQSRSEAAKRVSALEMQKMRQSLGVRESISDLSKSLHALDERMQAESKSLEELGRLKKLRVRAEKKLAALHKQDDKAEFLDSEAQQELQDLEELIVDLDSHIAFQDAELVAARNDLLAIKQRSESTDAKSPLDALANGLVQQLDLGNVASAAVTAAIVSKCLDEVSRLRMRVSEMGSEVQELQGLLSEREAALGQLESGLAVARNEFDRRLEAQQQESADTMEQLKKMQPQVIDGGGDTGQAHQDGEWQKLIVRCQKKDEYIADLEKHLVFYKSKAKQMQAQLQQLIRSSSEQQRRSDDEACDDDRERQLQRRIQQLEDANDALMKDLATAKVYLRSSQSRPASNGSAKVVRVSRSELRELPAPPSHVADSRENALAPTELEREHVHKVYDLIAPHFSHTRHHPWPQVTGFLDELEAGALVADVGCGNGKYLRVNPSLCMIGADRSIPLMLTAVSGDCNLLGGDALKVPLRTGAFDAALSIAVLHHISTDERRVALISELARLVRVGGEVLVVAWAFEQDERSKRKFEQQDVMVEWKLQQKYAEEGADEKESESQGRVDREKRWVVYERYCHVYRTGELEALVAQVPGLELVSVEYTAPLTSIRVFKSMNLMNADTSDNVLEGLPTEGEQLGSELTSEETDNNNDGSDTPRVVGSAVSYARECLRSENYTEATIALRSTLEITNPSSTSYKLTVLYIAQLLKSTQQLEASIDFLLSVYQTMPPPFSRNDGVWIIARLYEQLDSVDAARFWWKKAAKPDSLGWEALGDRLFELDLDVFAADCYEQALTTDPQNMFVPSSRFRYRYLTALLAFIEPSGPTAHMNLCTTAAWSLAQGFRHQNGRAPRHLSACYGDPHFYRMRGVYFTFFPAIYRVVFVWVDGPAGRIARWWRRQWAKRHSPSIEATPGPPLIHHAKRKTKKKPMRNTAASMQDHQPQSHCRAFLRRKVYASPLSPSRSPSPTKKSGERLRKNTTTTERHDSSIGTSTRTEESSEPSRRFDMKTQLEITKMSNNASSSDEVQQLHATTSDTIRNGTTLRSGAKESCDSYEATSTQQRTSVFRRLRVKHNKQTESSLTGDEDITAEKKATQSSCSSLLNLYPMQVPKTEDFVASCGREPGFADLNLDEVSEFARLAHYRARVLADKHARVDSLDTAKVKPQWLHDVDKAVALVESHQQRNLASGKVVVDGDSVAHLSEVHTRLVLLITTLCRQYTRDFSETSFTRKLRALTRRLVEWKFSRISEVVTALNNAKAIAMQEEKQRNLEFYHVHRDQEKWVGRELTS